MIGRPGWTRFPLVAVALVAIVGAACSSSDDAELGSDRQAVDAAAEGPAAPENLTDLEELWSNYLAIYDEVMQNGGSAAGAEGVASAGAIAALEVLGEENQQKVTDIEFDGIVEVTSSMNLISLDEDTGTLTDCTTHRIQTVLGDPFDIFATQEVAFEAGPSGGWLVSEVTVVQDGWFGEAFGCVPESYEREASRVAALFQEFGLQMERDPSQPLPQGLLDISSPEIEEAMLEARGTLESYELYSESTSDVFQQVLGLNFQFASVEGPVIRVESCVTYPDGQDLRALDTGEVTEQALPPGASQGTTIDVLVRSGLEGEVVAINPITDGTC